MKKILLAAVCAVSTFAAAPAYAEEGGEGRVELHSGIAWAGGESAVMAGFATGYDWDLGTSVFGGAEISVDKVFETGNDVSFSASARLGGKVGEGVKAYALGGYTVNTCDGCVNGWDVGAGAQYKVGEQVYLKAEYRHIFLSGGAEANVALAGVGVAL